MREVFLRLAHTSGSKIYGVILGVVSLTLTARMLGPQGRGEVAAVTTWITAFATFGHLSLGPVVMRNASLNFKGTWLSDSLSILIFNTVIMTIVSVAVIFGLRLFDPQIFGEISPRLMIFGLMMLPFMIWDSYGHHLLTASNEIEVYNRSQVISRTIGLVFLIALLAELEFGSKGVIISNAIGFAIGGGIGIYFLTRNTKLTFPSKEKILSFYKNGFTLHLNTIGTFLFSGADLLLLNYYKGTKETGLYQIGVQLIGVMLIIPQSASMIIYSQLASAGPDKGWQYQKKICFMVLGIMSFGALLAGVTTKIWLPLIVGTKFNESIGIFHLQLFSIPFMTLCTVLGPQWITRGLFWQSSLSAIFLALINLLSNRILITRYGAYGAASSTLITYTVAAMINIGLYLYCEKKSVLQDS